jgi:hypothetical protein
MTHSYDTASLSPDMQTPLSVEVGNQSAREEESGSDGDDEDTTEEKSLDEIIEAYSGE